MLFSFHFLIKNKTNRMKFVFYAMICLFLAITPAHSTVQTPAQQTLVQQPKSAFKDRILLKLLAFKIKHFRDKSLISKGIPGDCSKIVLKNGDVIEANISQITPVEVKYKRCGKPNDPETVIFKRDILSIIMPDGEKLSISSSNAPTTSNDSGASDEASYEGYSIAGFVTGLSSLILSASLLGLAAAIVGIVLSYLGLKRIRANPNKYKGKGLAKAGLILGIVGCALYAIILAGAAL
jgi:hypothetical protein